MTGPDANESPLSSRRAGWKLSLIGILLLGAVIIPLAVSLVFNVWGPLTVASAIRSAFGTVAAQVIAVLTGLTTVCVAVKRRVNIMQIVVFVVIALLIATNAYSQSAAAADLLLSRLELIAQLNAS